MAYSTYVYGLCAQNLWKGNIDFDTNAIKVALLTSSYSPAQDTDETWAGISANEIAGTGYTAGGATLANKTLTYTAGTNVLKVDADNVSWTTATFVARVMVIYDSATGYLIAYSDFAADKSVEAGTFTIEFNASGIITDTVS